MTTEEIFEDVCQCRQCVLQRERDETRAEVERLRQVARECPDVQALAEARATIERVKDAHRALIALRDKAATDADAGYRGSNYYSDAYENADRLIRTALEEKP